MEVKMAKRIYLNPESTAEMIEMWGKSSVEEIAAKLGVSTNTINMMAKDVNKLNPECCKHVKKVRRKRADVAKDALELLEKKGFLKVD